MKNIYMGTHEEVINRQPVANAGRYSLRPAQGRGNFGLDNHRQRGFRAENADRIDVPVVELRRTSRRVEQTSGLQQTG